MLHFLIQKYTLTQQACVIFLLSLIASLVLAPILIRFLQKKNLGQTVRQLGPKSHYSKTGTPTMGGFIFVVSPTLISILFLPIYSVYLWLILFTFLSLALLGFVDDYLKLAKHNPDGVRAKQKIFYQFMVSLIVGFGIFFTVGGNIYLPLLKAPVINLDYGIVIFVLLVIISWSNAVNLTDGLDGLAGGLSVFAMLPLIVVGFLEAFVQHTFLPTLAEGYIISLFLLALLASLLVFLWFNKPPAKIFMGDTGSLALGGVFAICSLLLKVEFLFAYVGFLFILENLSVIIQVYYYKKTKKRFFKMAPLHHHFEQKGIPETKIVIRACLIQIFLTVSALLVLCYKKS